MIIEGKQKIWADYQKDIPDDHYFYVRSCIRQAFWPGSEVTFLDITRNKLGRISTKTPIILPVAALPITATRYRKRRP